MGLHIKYAIPFYSAPQLQWLMREKFGGESATPAVALLQGTINKQPQQSHPQSQSQRPAMSPTTTKAISLTYTYALTITITPLPPPLSAQTHLSQHPPPRQPPHTTPTPSRPPRAAASPPEYVVHEGSRVVIASTPAADPFELKHSSRHICKKHPQQNRCPF